MGFSPLQSHKLPYLPYFKLYPIVLRFNISTAIMHCIYAIYKAVATVKPPLVKIPIANGIILYDFERLYDVKMKTFYSLISYRRYFHELWIFQSMRKSFKLSIFRFRMFCFKLIWVIWNIVKWMFSVLYII